MFVLCAHDLDTGASDITELKRKVENLESVLDEMIGENERLHKENSELRKG